MSGASLPRVEVFREPGGQTILVQSRRDVPVVFLELQCPGGRLCDPRRLPGLAELAAALLDEGPAGTDPSDWRRRLEGMAAEVAFAARADHWAAGFECLTEDLGAVSDLFLSAVTAPGLHRSEWKRLVKARLAAAREDWAQPSSVIRRLCPVQALGFGHPSAHPSFEKSYAQIDYRGAAELAAGALGRRGEVYLLVGGDISPEDGAALARRVITALPDRGAALPAEPEARPSAAPVWLIDHPRIDQAFFGLSRAGVRAGDPERTALRLANFMIGGGGFTSRLMDRVREAMGHTYGIGSSLPERRQAVPFVISSFTQVGNLRAMLELIDRVLAEIREGGFTAEELDLARCHSHGKLPLRLNNPRTILDFAAGGLRAGLDPERLEADWRSIPGMSLEAANAAARRIIGDGRFRLALVAPAAQARGQVEGRGDIAVIPHGATPDRWPV
ncbi:MAG TPA: insulinase family protein [Planctomycetota bacterium]|nr:insulinase family protein [Planctomycetota bacterium]